MENPEKYEWNKIDQLKRPNRLKRTTFWSKPFFPGNCPIGSTKNVCSIYFPSGITGILVSMVNNRWAPLRFSVVHNGIVKSNWLIKYGWNTSFYFHMFVLYSLFTPSPLTNVNTSTKSFSISFSTNCLPTDKNSFIGDFWCSQNWIVPRTTYEKSPFLFKIRSFHFNPNSSHKCSSSAFWTQCTFLPFTHLKSPTWVKYAS